MTKDQRHSIKSSTRTSTPPRSTFNRGALSFRSSLGQLGEGLALQYLLTEAFTLEAKNWRGKSGELDLIMRQGELLIIVEVRSTSHQWLERPAEATPLSKQRQVARCAHEYIQQRSSHLPLIMDIRFDILGLLIPPQLWRADQVTESFTPSTTADSDSHSSTLSLSFDHPEIELDHVENAYFSPWAF